MKTVFYLTIFVISSTYGGAGVDYIKSLKEMTIQELRLEQGVELGGDKIWFGTQQLSEVNICMSDEETFRTIHKRQIEELDGDYFKVVGHDYLYKSIYGSETYVDGDSTIDVEVVYPTTFEIKVLTEDLEFGSELLFKFYYTVPACI